MTGCDQHIWIATLLLFPTQSHRTHLHFQFLPDIITLPFCDLPHGEIKAWTLKIWRDFRPSFYVKQHINMFEHNIFDLPIPSVMAEEQ